MKNYVTYQYRGEERLIARNSNVFLLSEQKQWKQLDAHIAALDRAEQALIDSCP